MTTIADLVSAVGAGGVARVYKINEVPKSPTYPYAVVGIGSPDKIARTSEGTAADLSRCTAQFFGHDIDGVLDIATAGDLDGKFIGGRLCTRELTTSPFRDPDDQGVLAVLHTYQL